LRSIGDNRGPEFIDRIITGGVNQVGRRTLRMLITTWDAAGGGREPCEGAARIDFLPFPA